MAFLYAILAVIKSLLILMGILILFFGIPLFIFLLVQRSRRKLQIPESKSLPFWHLAANLLLSVVLTIASLWLIILLFDLCVRVWIN
jgi:hypothetical protein